MQVARFAGRGSPRSARGGACIGTCSGLHCVGWWRRHLDLPRAAADAALGRTLAISMQPRKLIAQLIGEMPPRRERTPADEPADAPGVLIDTDTFALVQKLLDRELSSRDALRSSLTGLLAFAGALLALSVAAEASVLQHGLGAIGQPLFFVVVGIAQALIVVTIIRAVRSLDTRPRARLRTQLLIDLGYQTREPEQVRALAYRVGASNLRDLVSDNDQLGQQVRAVVRSLLAALIVIAAAAVIIGARGIGLWKTNPAHQHPPAVTTSRRHP